MRARRAAPVSTMAEYIVSIDDTDDIFTKGTGAIAAELTDYVEALGLGSCGYITRHQLLIHPDIPYTSHNSAMAFTIRNAPEERCGFAEELSDYVLRECSPSSDPGICVCNCDKIADADALNAFGYLAKNKVLTQAYAFKTAEKAGVYLKAVAGTGDGVIGALAGAALRRMANDGELRGGAKEFLPGKSYSVFELLESGHIDSVAATDGEIPRANDSVYVPWKVKPILTGGALTVYVRRSEEYDGWVALNKAENRDIEYRRNELKSCPRFKEDADEEHVLPDTGTCLNCAFRRWTDTGFVCVLE